MHILFLMESRKEGEFQKLSGVKELLEELKENSWSWEYYCFTEAVDLAEQKGKEEEKKKTDLIITDSSAAAEQIGGKEICCLGYQSAESSGFFQGADGVFFSFADLDCEYLERFIHHFYGVPHVIAETERLLIRESMMEDFEELYQISQETGNSDYTETMPGDYEFEKEKFRAYIANEYRYFDIGLWTVLEKQSRQVIGRFGLFPMEEQGNLAFETEGIELGYLLDKKAQKKGYAQEACRAILFYAFQVLGYQEIYAVIHKKNRPSRRLAERLGFEKVGMNEEKLCFCYQETKNAQIKT